MASHNDNTSPGSTGMRPGAGNSNRSSDQTGLVHSDKPTPDRTDIEPEHAEHISPDSAGKPEPDTPSGAQPETNAMEGDATRDTEELSSYHAAQHVGADHPTNPPPGTPRPVRK
jgi:hypothetical protein